MALPAAPRQPHAPGSPTGRPVLDGSGFAGLTRRRLAFGLGALVVLWIVLVFGRAVASQVAATTRAETLRTENAVRQDRFEAGRRELRIVQSQAFVRLQARAYGLGAPGEHAFALDRAAPGPRRIPALGGPVEPVSPPGQLEAWLTLFFGH